MDYGKYMKAYETMTEIFRRIWTGEFLSGSLIGLLSILCPTKHRDFFLRLIMFEEV